MSAARAKAGAEPALGIIGGSGLYEMEGLEDVRWVRVRTPFGDPSDAYCTGRFGDRRVIFLPRHGRGHRLTPTEINYRANIYGLKALGAALGHLGQRGRQHEGGDPPARSRHPRPVLRPHPAARLDASSATASSAHVGMADPVCPALGDAARDRRAAEAGATRAPRRHLHLHRGAAVLDQGRVAASTAAGACRSSA